MPLHWRALLWSKVTLDLFEGFEEDSLNYEPRSRDKNYTSTGNFSGQGLQPQITILISASPHKDFNGQFSLTSSNLYISAPQSIRLN
ncbi:hypothetical protein NPIL_15251 [Nephila pilipes]|uniref:Uncharacterized protein n=1 Tax=Nephila pilipes TaxID=299642 RepID=A0A8X6TDK1_NEPPI|nr:hypothetical protein NPIL_15251 [Nephila pilipes]